MLQLTPQMRILVAIEPVDFRKGIDGLSQLCRNQFEENPFSGAVFVFRNRRKTAIKALIYDGQGFWLCTKRIEKGLFAPLWKRTEEKTLSLSPSELQLFLEGSQLVEKIGLSPSKMSKEALVIMHEK